MEILSLFPHPNVIPNRLLFFNTMEVDGDQGPRKKSHRFGMTWKW